MHEQYLQTDLKARLQRWHKNPDAAFWGWNGPWLDPEFRHWNIEGSLPGIAQPILVVQGENDEYGSVAQVDAIRRQAAGRVQTALLPDCGHSPHRDQPEKTLQAMVDFLHREGIP